MIFTLIPHPHRATGCVIIPIERQTLDAFDLFVALSEVFPNDHSFNLCCWSGYDNAIEFIN